MNQYVFNLKIGYDEFLPIYRGSINKLVVRDVNGRTIELPAAHFKQFLTPQGVNGRFKLLTESSGKFQSLSRLV
jgi:hypothetical protein